MKLHRDDFIEMLERGDTASRIAAYCGVTIGAVDRRFHRLPKDVKERIMNARNGASIASVKN